jgi:hypothetical protein
VLSPQDISEPLEFLRHVQRIFSAPVGLKMARECMSWISDHEADPHAVPDFYYFARFKELAACMAFLLIQMHRVNRNEDRDALLKALAWKQRGRPRKASQEISFIVHGSQMRNIWDTEMLEVWNLKVSLERQGKAPSAGLQNRGLNPGLVQVICRRRATPESCLARVYSGRVHISFESARNALRYYMKMQDWILTPHV